MLLVWALRACSYKTKAEDWAAGHRLHLYQGVYLGFCLASSNDSMGSKGSRGSSDLSNDCLSLSSSFLFLTISYPQVTLAHALYIYKVRA